jgi:hypothetical protein
LAVSQPVRHLSSVIAEVTFALLGIILLVVALAANQPWLDRHFLPSFLVPHEWYVRIETGVRLAIGGTGLWLAFVARRPAGQIVTRMPSRSVHVVLAAILALGASELVLRRVSLRPAEWLLPEEEPRRRPDERLGWTFVPARVGHDTVGGRAIEYAFDSSGYRVRGVDAPVDPERPTIIFVGESVMFGEGLRWDESVPAQVGMMTGTQSANLAVHGFGSDQAFLRLQTDLPRFRRPVAVISLFMTALFGRNLDDDRPHLGPGLVWFPARQHSRLASLAGLLVPYRRDETVERGVSTTSEVLRATVRLAQARGATSLTVVPHFGREQSADERIRRRILDDAGVPYVLVEIDASWHLPWDRHPDARAARLMATAIANRLSGR